MNDLMLLQKDKPFQNLQTVISDFISRKTNKASCFEMFKEIRVQQFEHEALMLTEIALVKHSDDVVLVVGILLHDVTKILGFFVSELMIHLCVTRDLQRQDRFIFLFMVSALDHLSKGAFAQNFHYFISIRDVFANLNSVVAFEVIKHWVSLILSVRMVFLSFLFIFEYLFSLSVHTFQNVEIIAVSCSDGSSEIDRLKLICSWT